MLILILYIDDLLITWENHLIFQCKKDLALNFGMKNLGILHYLGLEVWQKLDGILSNQGKHVIDTLKIFGMLNCRPMSTPMEKTLHKLKEVKAKSIFEDPTLYKHIIRSLMCLVNTWSNIFYVVSALSHSICEPHEMHLVFAKHILWYLQGTIGYGLKYKKVDLDLHGYSDSKWARSVTNWKGKSRCFFQFGINHDLLDK